jgi:hypothetical protein
MLISLSIYNLNIFSINKINLQVWDCCFKRLKYIVERYLQSIYFERYLVIQGVLRPGYI